MKKYLYMTLTIIWIGIIFSFSLQVAEKSTVVSDSVGELILEKAPSNLVSESTAWTETERDRFHAVVRKCAHFIEFFILGMFMILTMNQTKVTRVMRISLVLCVVVAAMDETLQLFVPGRAGLLTDVLLDSFGSFIGILLCVFLMKVRKKHG